MAKCYYCGEEVEDGEKICNYCKEELEADDEPLEEFEK